MISAPKIPKKNSCRGNYMKKNGILKILNFKVPPFGLLSGARQVALLSLACLTNHNTELLEQAREAIKWQDF
jgi:hypothetical protein